MALLAQGKVLQKAVRTCKVYLVNYVCLKTLCQNVFLLLPMASRLMQERTSKRKVFRGFTWGGLNISRIQLCPCWFQWPCADFVARLAFFVPKQHWIREAVLITYLCTVMTSFKFCPCNPRMVHLYGADPPAFFSFSIEW